MTSTTAGFVQKKPLGLTYSEIRIQNLPEKNLTRKKITFNQKNANEQSLKDFHHLELVIDGGRSVLNLGF